MPLVSIIIPVHNAERFLAAAVDSVLGQTYKEWELILIDDGSTDQSGAICDRFAALHRDCIRVIHRDNNGMRRALNAGLDIARGEFVAFMDADDFIIPEYLELLCAKQAETDADMVGASYVRITPYMNTIVHREFYGDEIYTADTMHDFLANHGNFFCAAWDKLFRKSLIDEYQLQFMEDLSLSEDHLFLCCYAAVCTRVASVSQIAYYRWGKEGATQKVCGCCLDVVGQCIEVFQQFVRKYKIHTAFVREIPRFWRMKYNCSI